MAALPEPSISERTWELAGSADQIIYGDTHLPAQEPVGAVVIAHGFKGYKDYGMFPHLARQFAQTGLIAHRFNFSHSGMTRATDTFERPDLFRQDTWNRQVEDLVAIDAALDTGVLAGGALPRAFFGHSRGGVSVLLAMCRPKASPAETTPACLITAASPSTCNSLDPLLQETLLQDGSLPSPSSRTGQLLEVGRDFLQEQLDDPPGHDLTTLVRAVPCPLLVVHGDKDPTVPVASAISLANAAGTRATLHLIEDADHVFNTPNPMPEDAPPSRQLDDLVTRSREFMLSRMLKDSAAV